MEVVEFLHDKDELSYSCFDWNSINGNCCELECLCFGRNINPKVVTKNAGCER